jgi:uncharacterized cupin superfamily protein
MDASAARAFQGALVHAQDGNFDLVPMSIDDFPPEEVMGFRIEGRPEMAARVVWVSDDRRSAVLVERMGPCKVIGHHQTEVFYLLEGRWTARRPDGTEYEVKGGDFVCFVEGQEEEVTVHETFTKCAFYHSSRPLPYEVTP